LNAERHTDCIILKLKKKKLKNKPICMNQKLLTNDVEASGPSDVAPDVDIFSRQRGDALDAPFVSFFKHKRSHPEDLIIGNKNDPRNTRSTFRNESSMMGLLLIIEPTKADEALSVVKVGSSKGHPYPDQIRN
jgi:hypothetical protein